MKVAVLTADPGWEESRATGASTDHLARSLVRLRETAGAVTAVLEGDGHAVATVAVNGRLAAALARAGADVVFNTYFGPARRMDQAHVVSLMEYAGLTFSGSGAGSHFAGLAKPVSKALLEAAGLPVAPSVLAASAEEAQRRLVRAGLRFPLLVKVPAEGEGIGMDSRSIIRAPAEAAAAVERILRRFAPPVMVEEFLPGREFTVGVVDGEEPEVLPVLEIKVPPQSVLSFEAKTSDSFEEICPAPLPLSEAGQLGLLAVRAGRALGCRDYWRVDFRADAEGRPRVLEVNTLPGLQPGYSDMARMAEAAASGYAGLVRGILRSALRRTGATV